MRRCNAGDFQKLPGAYRLGSRTVSVGEMDAADGDISFA